MSKKKLKEKYIINRKELPYDAMIPNSSWLIPINKNNNSKNIQVNKK